MVQMIVIRLVQQLAAMGGIPNLFLCFFLELTFIDLRIDMVFDPICGLILLGKLGKQLINLRVHVPDLVQNRQETTYLLVNDLGCVKANSLSESVLVHPTLTPASDKKGRSLWVSDHIYIYITSLYNTMH
jgi:hypothetical protein